jgi:hypothetical protein
MRDNDKILDLYGIIEELTNERNRLRRELDRIKLHYRCTADLLDELRTPEYKERRAAMMKRFGITPEAERVAHEILFGGDDD